jgi:DNA-directed RNA polymerase specialized sigma subunit
MNSPAKKLLREYRDLCFEERSLVVEIDRLDAIAKSPGAVKPRFVTIKNNTPKEKLSGQIANKAEREDELARVRADITAGRKRVEALVSCLQSRDRRIVRMRYIELKSWVAIAHELECTPRTVHRHHRELLEYLNMRLTGVTEM